MSAGGQGAVMDPYRLEIPPDPDFFTTARLFAAAVARRSGSEAIVDDVKLAVTEAASLLLGASASNAPIAIEASLGGTGLHFSIVRPGAVPDMSPDPDLSDTLLGMDLVRAIFPTLSISESGTGSVSIEFDAPG